MNQYLPTFLISFPFGMQHMRSAGVAEEQHLIDEGYKAQRPAALPMMS
jgi:hypothetical protein